MVGSSCIRFALLLLLVFLGVRDGESTCIWDNCPGFVNDGKTVNLHMLAHTHDDMGWLKTADDYFTGFNTNTVNRAVAVIIDTVVEALKRNPERRFSYAEVGFLTRWLESRSADEVQDLVSLVNNGQLELIGGGWVQPDEAGTHYIELIDMYTLGARRLNHTFGGACSKPRSGWQIDPFGHSKEHANLLAMMGYESVYFAREHHREHDLRREQKRLEFQWFTSDDNPSRKLQGGVFFNHYNHPNGFCFDWACNDVPVVIDPQFDNYDPDAVISRIRDYVEHQRLPTMPHKHVLFMMGDDFQYENAEQNFRNLDNLIWLVNNRTEYKAFYSSPACYTRAIQGAGVAWTNKTYDFFPYASSSDSFWTGYFTSKPAFKGLIRSSSNYLNTLNVLNAYALQAGQTEYSTGIEQLERAVGLSLHHDAVTGTSKEHVTQDYEYRIFQGLSSTRPVHQNALQAISQRVQSNTVAFPPQTFCLQLNETACPLTQDLKKKFSIILVNGHSRPVSQYVKIPLQSSKITFVDDANNAVAGAAVSTTFINGLQLNNSQIAPFQLQFTATIPPNGFATYFVTDQAAASSNVQLLEVEATADKHPKQAKTLRLSNGVITVTFDDNNLLQSVTTKDGTVYPLKQRFMYYAGHDDNGRASGAYIFRPQDNTAKSVNDKPSLVTVGLEARQVFSEYVSQTVRLTPDRDFVEFEWTVGPLPEEDVGGKRYGKELISRYETGVNSGSVFYTDANGRQMVRRQRSFNPDYSFEDSEPVAANYFPVNSRVVLKDAKSAMAVLTDRTQAAGSILDNSVEFLLHRRDFYDDGFGVSEALNEPGRDGRGLVVRGVHRVVFSDPATIASKHRELAFELYNAPVVSFAEITSVDAYKKDFATQFSGLAAALPANVRLLTLKQLDSSTVLLRLEHIYQNGEDSTLSLPATVDVSTLFSNLKVTSVQEMSLAANAFVSGSSSTKVTLNPQDIKTFQLTVNL